MGASGSKRLGKAKIIFRDIVEHPTFWLDIDGTVVNGDCYWIPAVKKTNLPIWLSLWAILLLSSAFTITVSTINYMPEEDDS